MKTLQEAVLTRIQQLRPQIIGNSYGVGIGYAGVTNLASLLYGKDSPVLDAIQEVWKHNNATHAPGLTPSHSGYYDPLAHQLMGILDCIKSDVQAGLVGSIEARLQAEVFADFRSLTTIRAGADS